MKNALSKLVFFAWGLVCVFQLSSAKTASFKAYGLQAAFYPASTSNGFIIYFTTYDGETTWPLHESNIYSNEFKPEQAGSSIYRADYLAAIVNLGETDSFEHGAISLNLPTTDLDGNGVFDWLQQDMAVNEVDINGTAAAHWSEEGGTSSVYTISGQITRPAGSQSGSYSMTWSLDGAEDAVATGTWDVGFVPGSFTYEDGSYDLSASTTAEDGSPINVSGSSTYGSIGTDILRLGAIQLTDGTSTSVLASTSLTRKGNQYSAKVSFNDGKHTTSWSDYVDWLFVITDENDDDDDDIPDLTDSPSSASAQLSFDGWNYHIWPWVYSNADADWLYYVNTPSGWVIWRRKDSSWYIFDATSNTWSSL